MPRGTKMREWVRQIKQPTQEDLSTFGSEEVTVEDIQSGLERLHENLGHADVPTMLRMLKFGKANAKALKLCRDFSRKDCPRHQRPRLHRSVTSLFG